MSLRFAFFILLLCINVNGQRFTTGQNGAIFDEFGRLRIFHGTNFVQKGFPWYPEVLLNVSNIKQLASWGFNAIRLGTMWTGAQPTATGFNQTYYDVLLDIVSTLSAYGIDAILDCHQDVLSSFFCEYDGAPQWLVEKSLNESKQFPWPLPGTCYDRPWASNYLTAATGRAFQDIYSNRHDMRDSFKAFWSHTASVFANQSFLGYELWNEPWCGDFYEDPALLLPGVAGRLNLQPLYRELHSAITEVDAHKHLTFFEPVTWGIVFNGTVLGTGFSETPGNDPSMSVLSWHYYCWVFDNTNVSVQVCDRVQGPQCFRAVQDDLKRLGCGGFLTEWGLCDPSDQYGLEECNFVMELADQHFMSWTNWDFGGRLGGNNWDIGAMAPWVAALSRPYIRAFAGQPLNMTFDPSTLIFTTSFLINTTITAATELYIPPVHYPTGGSIRFSGLSISESAPSLPNVVFFDSVVGATVGTIILSP